MSHLSKIFEEAPIKVQNRNGFDLSHVHSGTSKCGQLVPVLTKLLAPNTTISLGVNAEVSLPPLVAPFYGKIDFAIEGFIVPCSILYGGWKQFISNQESTQFPATQAVLSPSVNPNAGSEGVPVVSTTSKLGYTRTPHFKSGYEIPYADYFDMSLNNLGNFNTLRATNDCIYDYMGLGAVASIASAVQTELPISLLPALAYHRICDVFYRNTKLTRTWFEVNPNWYAGASATAAGGYRAVKNVGLIWHSWYTNTEYGTSGSAGAATVRTAAAKFDDTASLTFSDNVSIFSTRQRTYMRDYFTSAVYNPQQGGYSSLKFAVDTTDNTGEFTINSLRMANSLQKFLETNNLSGDYAEMSRNRWGVRPIDADFEEPHYLGRVVVPVYQHTLYQNNQVDPTSIASSNNPYVAAGQLGATGGAAKAGGEGSICDNFNVSCWSYLMCLASIYPHANYNYGINRELTMTNLGDFPAPELQSVGMEEIKTWELGAAVNGVSFPNFMQTFGYIPRYSRFKYMDDHASGELRPGKTLEHFQLQRAFNALPVLSTSFVTIAQNALDGILAVDTATMNLTCWWEIFFKFRVVMPLADYCIPTLGELGDTHTIKTTVSGSRL